MKRLLIVLLLLSGLLYANLFDDGKQAYYNTNYQKAFKIFKKLAEQGNANAENGLGVMYMNGQGVRQNYPKAVYWFKKSTMQGNTKAQNNLGLMYIKGQGIRQNYQKAFKIFKKLAEQGNPNAENNLGNMYSKIYINGKGIKQDYKKAIYWYKKAAMQGNANAQYNLGLMYIKGQGILLPNKSLAKEYFGQACDNGLEEGCKSYKVLNELGY